jgi:hypothetical protein
MSDKNPCSHGDQKLHKEKKIVWSGGSGGDYFR